jgi:hypothetical protein
MIRICASSTRSGRTVSISGVAAVGAAATTSRDDGERVIVIGGPQRWGLRPGSAGSYTIS